MILVYPMLTSSDINPHIVPGICKAIEKFLLIYGIDGILKEVNIDLKQVVKTGGQLIKTSQGMLTLKEDVGFPKDAPSFDKPYINISNVLPVQKQDTPTPAPKDTSREIQTKVNIPKGESLSISPTWVEIQTKKKGLQILGVKVIPFPVTSSESLITLLLDDSKRKFLDYSVRKYSRTAVRMFWSLCRGLHIPVIKDRALTGDPKKDIIFATTQYKKNNFILLNKMDIEENNIFNRPKDVQKLHKLGWTSFIVADDINKTATFCMKEFKGLCSTTLYSFIYSSLGKEHSQVYKDLEDVRKSATPFFRVRKSGKSLFREEIEIEKDVQNNIIYEDNEYLTEDISSFMKSLTKDKIKKISTSLDTSFESKDISKIKKSLSSVPLVSSSNIKSMCKKLTPDFESNYKLSELVIKNSLNIPERFVEFVSCIIALGSSYKIKDSKKETKKNLKMFVSRVRTYKIEDNVDGIVKVIIAVLGVFVGVVAASIKTITGVVAALFAASNPIPATVLIIAIALIMLVILTKDS